MTKVLLVSVLMIVDISAYLTLTDTYVDWQVSVAVLELGSVTIHGTVNHAGGYSAVSLYHLKELDGPLIRRRLSLSKPYRLLLHVRR